MGLMELFRKSEPVSDSEQPTAIEYVDWLLIHMLRTSRTALTIDTSRALPGGGHPADDDPPPCMPDAQAVVNRLKILSGVNPIRQPKIVTGNFERPRANHIIVVTTQFQDDAEKSSCAIQLRFRRANA